MIFLKKVVGVILLIIVIVAISLFIFSNDSNDFSNITKIEYQKYNHSKDKYGELKVIEDDETLSQLTKLINKATHQNFEYNKAYHDDIKLTLLYIGETAETVRIWKDFGKDYDLLESETRDGIYEIKNNNSRETLREILK